MPLNTTEIAFVDKNEQSQTAAAGPTPSYIVTDHNYINTIVKNCGAIINSHTLSDDSANGAKINDEAIIICNGKMVSLNPTSSIVAQLSAAQDCLPTGGAPVPFVLFPMSNRGATISQSLSVDEFSMHVSPMAWGTITKTAVEGNYTFNVNYLDYPISLEDAQ